ncbi:MAG TPA: hypothetical protein DET40_13120 [Lentisphaeria bacterium]|nr:MAG: hypothetical protein A2X45_17430 [Lentisphaerae bacterium GWF2_50_93]HCE44483.1 hypothetical protein [Lentisphaeria bacterium]
MKRPFNLIEVTLSIAVIGIGMVGIMSLFPVGLDATRQSIAENYAADAADQFLSYIMRNCNDTTLIYDGPGTANDKDFYDYYIYYDKNTPTNLADDTIGGYELWEEADFWGKPWNGNDADAKIAEDVLTIMMPDPADIYWSPTNLTRATGYPGLYKIKQGSALVTDFEAIVRVWKSPITGVYVYEQNLDVTYPYACRLNMEISWPAQKPYSKRDKRSFCVEIFRQKF